MINWSSGVGLVYIERGVVKFVWCAHEHLPGCMNKIAELSFTRMIDFHALQCLLWTGLRCNSICVANISCRCILLVGEFCTCVFPTVACFVDGRGREIARNKHADSSQQYSVPDSQQVKNHFIQCRNSMNHN